MEYGGIYLEIGDSLLDIGCSNLSVASAMANDILAWVGAVQAIVFQS
jgi:hypothetical protein